MKGILRRFAAPAALLFATAGCSTGGVGDVLGGVLNSPESSDGTATVNAEIQDNDDVRQQVRIRTTDGREAVVRWDSGTEVIYLNERYSPAALERGDLVQMRIRETSDGELYTDYVVVTQSVQERTGVPE
jgi:hypothetical protein